MKGIIGAIRNLLNQRTNIAALTMLSLVLCAPAAFASLPAERQATSDRSLVVVDATIRDPATFNPGGAGDRLLRIDGGSDALAAIARVVSEEGPFDSLHIVSHGQSGSMSLGGQQVDLQVLSESSLSLDAIAAGLASDAGVFLYGCNIAGMESGQTFVDAFADRLGRPVAASVDTTGGSDLGGDWDLEYTTSKIITSNPFNFGLLDGYADTLSHFRGGSISWQAADLDSDGRRNDIRITVKTAWRSDAAVSIFSLGSTPALTITQSNESLIYVGGTGPLDSDYALQTTILEARDLDPDTKYLINYSSSARIGNLVNNANGAWNIQSTVYLADNNLAPKIDLPIIFQVPQFQSDGTTVLTDWTYDIGSTDPNADKLRYRLANLSELGGGTNPDGLSINPNTGLLTWSGSGTKPTGLYSGGIVAEDVDEFGNPKSKSHVDFILDLQPTAAVAFTQSSDIPETNNIRVEKGATYEFSITGSAIETTSLGDIQGALTETTEGNFVFDPGPVGSGLDPASYPITFEISDSNGGLSNSYLTLNFIVPDPNAPNIERIEGDRTIYNSLVSQPVDEKLDALLSDVDNTHFNGGRIKFNVTFTDGQYEILAIESVGDGLDEIRVDGADIYYEGNHFATASGTLDGVGKALSVDFTSEDATIAAVQKLVRSLTYEDTFILRAVGDRALSVFIEDPEGHTSSYDLFIDVQAHPSAPPPGGGPVEAANELVIVEGATVSISDENLNYADPDDGDTVTLTVSSMAHGQFELVSSAGNAITTFTQEQVTLGQIAFAHDGSEVAPSFDVSASDGTNPATTPSAASITFTNVADQAPVISGTPATTAAENSAYTFTPAATDADIGTGSDLIFAVSNLPAWATFDTETGTMSGLPESADIGTHSNIVISVTDDGGLGDALPAFSVTVAPDPDTDGDGVPESVELADGTNPNDAGDYRDTDGDGAPDYIETVIDGTDPDDSNDYVDSDSDGVPDYVEDNVYGTDPQVPDAGDTDGDGVPDYQESYVDGTAADDTTNFADSDGDGVPDHVETNVYGTDPQVADAGDADGDGVPDYTESFVDGTDPGDGTAFADSDGDGVPDYVETNVYGTDPQVADSGDTDGDGVPDYNETYVDFTDPDDATDYRDSDDDGVPDHVEVNADNTDPSDANDFTDTDGDGVPDYVETERDGTDPDDSADNRDSDGDGVPDYVEVAVYDTDPQTADAGDTDGDGVPDYTETYVHGTDPSDATLYLDSDNDGVPDHVETEVDGTDPQGSNSFVDTDSDGVPDYVETNIEDSDPVDPTNYQDSDGDGVADYVEAHAGTDPGDPADAPVTFATVDATGLYTPVSFDALETLGLIAAGDAANCCGDYPQLADSGAPMFEPGRNRIEWAGQGTNVLIVRPIVSLGPDTNVAEGQVASFTVWLNGPAANYPLIVPYTISGTANDQDHDLDAEGAAVFLAGETSTTVTFMVAADTVTEGDETIVVALDDAGLNIGTAAVQTLSIVESNLSAQVKLRVAQDGDPRMTVSQASGPVTVTALVDDPNGGDSHTYQWSVSDGSLVDNDDDTATFTFDSQTVVEGVYEVTVTVTDDGEPAQSGIASVRIRVLTSLPQLDDTDSDGDGISDMVEGHADTDQDGIPDYLDAHPAMNVMQESSDEPQSFLVECDAGNGCRIGMMAMAGTSGGALLSQDQASALLQDADYDNVGGLFDVDILMPVAGQQGRIVIPQRAPVPSAASFRIYIDGGWRDFVHNDANGIYSAPGNAGMCPPPGNAAYTPGLAEGDWCVMVVIEEGGPNDVDKLSDFTASMTGGVGEASEIVYKTNGGSNGGGSVHPAILLILTIGLFGAVRRRLVVGRIAGLPLLAAVLAVMVAAPGITHAQSTNDGTFASETWWRSVFVSANFGSANTDVGAADLEARFAARGTSVEVASIDRRRAGWGVSAGYRLDRLLPGLVAEVGYQDLGEVDVTFSALSTTNGIADVRPESGDGVTASAAYRLALSDRFGLQLRGGLYAWEADYESYRMDSESIVDSGSASGTDLYWGLGGYWQVLERMSVDAEYQQYEFDRQPAGYFRIALRWSFDY